MSVWSYIWTLKWIILVDWKLILWSVFWYWLKLEVSSESEIVTDKIIWSCVWNETVLLIGNWVFDVKLSCLWYLSCFWCEVEFEITLKLCNCMKQIGHILVIILKIWKTNSFCFQLIHMTRHQSSRQAARESRLWLPWRKWPATPPHRTGHYPEKWSFATFGITSWDRCYDGTFHTERPVQESRWRAGQLSPLRALEWSGVSR